MQNGSGVTTLLDHFTFVGDNGSSFNTPWVSILVDLEQVQLTILVHSRTGTSSVTVQPQTTYDTDQTTNLGAGVATGAAGTPNNSQLTSNIGPMIRLNLSCAANNTFVCLSVFITPKRA